MWRRMTMLAAGLMLAATAEADGLDALRDYFESVTSLQGRFEQTTRDESGVVVEEADGHFALIRPERFDWYYESPFEQRITADGDWLYVHDVELEQVSIRPLDEVLGVGPAILLSGDFESLRESFELDAGEQGISLVPRSGDWEFQRIHLYLSDGVPTRMRIEDGLGQTVSLELHDLDRNADIDPERFRFEAPAGADVIAPPAYPVGGDTQ